MRCADSMSNRYEYVLIFGFKVNFRYGHQALLYIFYCPFQNLETAKSELTKFKSELELLRKQSGAGEVKVQYDNVKALD